MTEIRTAKHVTITEAHPFHGSRSIGWPHSEVWVEYDPRCPLCRAEGSDGGQTTTSLTDAAPQPTEGYVVADGPPA